MSAPSPELSRFFDDWRRRRRRAALAEAFGQSVAAFATLFGLALVLDRHVFLESSTRVLSSALACGIPLAILAFGLWRAARPRGDLALAAELEADGSLAGLVRSSVELGREAGSSASPELLERVHELAAARVSALTDGPPVDERRAKRGLGLAVALSIPIAIAFILWPESSRLLAERFASPGRDLPRPTSLRLEVTPGNLVAARGGSVELRLLVGAKTEKDGLPAEAELLTRRAGAAWTREILALAELPGGGRGVRVERERLESEFSYRFRAGDAESPVFRIELRDPPRAERIEFTIEAPSYSARPAETLEYTGGELRLLEGSECRLDLSADRKLRAARATLRSAGEDEARSLAVTLRGSKASFASFRAARSESPELTIELEDEAGLAVTLAPIPLVVERDRPPRIALLEPAAERVRAERASLLELAYRAEDDLGLAELALVLARGDEAEGARERLILPLSPAPDGSPVRFLEDRASVPLAPLALTRDGLFEFWLELRDRRGQLARSARRELEIIEEPSHPFGTAWRRELTRLEARSRDLAEELADAASATDPVREALARRAADLSREAHALRTGMVLPSPKARLLASATHAARELAFDLLARAAAREENSVRERARRLERGLAALVEIDGLEEARAKLLLARAEVEGLVSLGKRARAETPRSFGRIRRLAVSAWTELRLLEDRAPDGPLPALRKALASSVIERLESLEAQALADERRTPTLLALSETFLRRRRSIEARWPESRARAQALADRLGVSFGLAGRLAKLAQELEVAKGARSAAFLEELGRFLRQLDSLRFASELSPEPDFDGLAGYDAFEELVERAAERAIRDPSTGPQVASELGELAGLAAELEPFRRLGREAELLSMAAEGLAGELSHWRGLESWNLHALARRGRGLGEIAAFLEGLEVESIRAQLDEARRGLEELPIESAAIEGEGARDSLTAARDTATRALAALEARLRERRRARGELAGARPALEELARRRGTLGERLDRQARQQAEIARATRAAGDAGLPDGELLEAQRALRERIRELARELGLGQVSRERRDLAAALELTDRRELARAATALAARPQDRAASSTAEAIEATAAAAARLESLARSFAVLETSQLRELEETLAARDPVDERTLSREELLERARDLLGLVRTAREVLPTRLPPTPEREELLLALDTASEGFAAALAEADEKLEVARASFRRGEAALARALEVARSLRQSAHEDLETDPEVDPASPDAEEGEEDPARQAARRELEALLAARAKQRELEDLLERILGGEAEEGSEEAAQRSAEELEQELEEEELDEDAILDLVARLIEAEARAEEHATTSASLAVRAERSERARAAEAELSPALEPERLTTEARTLAREGAELREMLAAAGLQLDPRLEASARALGAATRSLADAVRALEDPDAGLALAATRARPEFTAAATDIRRARRAALEVLAAARGGESNSAERQRAQSAAERAAQSLQEGRVDEALEELAAGGRALDGAISKLRRGATPRGAGGEASPELLTAIREAGLDWQSVTRGEDSALIEDAPATLRDLAYPSMYRGLVRPYLELLEAPRSADRTKEVSP